MYRRNESSLPTRVLQDQNGFKDRAAVPGYDLGICGAVAHFTKSAELIRIVNGVCEVFTRRWIRNHLYSRDRHP